MNRETELAFQAARDTSNQIITLTAAIIFIMATFAKDFIQETAPIIKWFVLCSGISFIVSIGAGICTLMVLTGKFGGYKETDPSPSIWDKNVILPAKLQIIFFGIRIGAYSCCYDLSVFRYRVGVFSIACQCCVIKFPI